MTPNVISCAAWRLYVIVDRSAAAPQDLVSVAQGAIRGGADVIQLRDKAASAKDLIQAARRLLSWTRAAGIPLIINDRVDVVRAVGADGVHLGQDDLPLAMAREILGPHRLIGQSTHGLEQALAADAAGADYIAFGPIFPTPTKPEYGSVGTAPIGEVTRQVTRPVVCIGGIDSKNLEQVLLAGATCIAVVRAVCAANPEAAARTLKQALTQFLRTRETSSI